MDFTPQQELILLAIAWICLVVGFIIWNDYE